MQERNYNRRQFAAMAATSLATAGLFVAFGSKAVAEPEATQETLDKLADAQGRYDDAQTKLGIAGEDLEEADMNLSITQNQLAETQTNISDTKDAIELRNAELEHNQEILASRVKSNYKTGNADVLSVIFEAQNYTDFTSRVRFMSEVSNQDADLIEDVKNIKAELEADQESLELREAEETALIEQQTEQKADIEVKVADLQTLLDSLDDEVKDLMEQKAEEVKAAKEAEEKAAAAAAAAAGTSLSPDMWTAGMKYSSVTEAAVSQLGKPYVWGAEGPNTFDCSGLCQYAFLTGAGILIPRVANDQRSRVVALGHLTYDKSQLIPGNLCFFGSGQYASHVAMYLGDGNIVHAPKPGDVVRISSLSIFSTFIGGGSVV